MTLDETLLAELLKTFLIDLDAQTETLVDALLALEGGELPKEQCQESYAAIMRAAHNLKGGARGLDLRDMVEMFHRVETLIAGLRDSGAMPAAAFINRCMKILEAVRSKVATLAAGSESDIDLLSMVEELENEVVQPKDTGAPPKASLSEPSPSEAQAVKPASADTGPPSADAAYTAAKPPDSHPVDLADAAPGRQVVRIQLDQLGKVSALADELLVTRSGIAGNHNEVCSLQTELSHSLRYLKQLYSYKNEGNSRQIEKRDKLFMEHLDRLGEFSRRVEHLQTSMRFSARALGRLTTSLCHELKLMRLVPAKGLLIPFMMTGRSLAVELGKQIEITIKGGEISMDRLLLERLQSPLNHLLRNAIDHGIEDPGIRQQQGKPAVGRIEIILEQQGNNVKLSLVDDGCGIDADAIAEAAVRHKLIDRDEAEAMNQNEKLQLILESGLSTCNQISQTSGRGVGMNEVSTTIRALHGSLEMETEVGVGSCISMLLPVMLAQERGLVVVAAGQRFVLPTLSLERAINFEIKDITQVEGSQAIQVDGRALPLRSLAQVLELGPALNSSGDSRIAVALGHGQSRVAFLVDEVEDEQEIVVKQLAPPLKTVRNIKGATYDDNGNVIIVIDPKALLQSVLQQHAATDRVIHIAESEEAVVHRILVVDDSLTTRTLEKNILEGQGYQVSVCNDGKEALGLLRSDDPFDMVVTDVEMPFMDGFELTEAIKSSADFATIPVIIVTSLERDDQRRRGMEVGADAYIVKSSFESKALLETVQRLL